MIGRSGERGSEISVLVARHDDNDDADINILIFFCVVFILLNSIYSFLNRYGLVVGEESFSFGILNESLGQCPVTRHRETWVQSQVESYQRLKKWYLMPPCLTLSIIRYGSRVK